MNPGVTYDNNIVRVIHVFSREQSITFSSDVSSFANIIAMKSGNLNLCANTFWMSVI